MAQDRHPDSKEKDGHAKQHDDEQGGGGGNAGGGGQTKHAEGTQSANSKNDRTGSGTSDSSRESNS